MSLLIAALVVVVASLLIARLAAEGKTSIASWGLVVLVLVVPLVHSAWVLGQAAPRLDNLYLTYLGKHLGWSAERPVTVGGSERGSEEWEDLHAANLIPNAIRLQPADAALVASAASPGGLTEGDPVLRLATPAPVVLIDGEIHNSHPLAAGDVLVARLADGSSFEIEIGEGTLASGGETYALPGFFDRLFRGPGQLAYLPDVLPKLKLPGSDELRSLIHLPRTWGPWHLVLRDEAVSLRRVAGDEVRFQRFLPVPSTFDLRLQVAWGSTGQRRLRTVRRDTLIVGENEVEVRFDAPQRRMVHLAEVDESLEMGLVVPSTIDRRRRLIEFDESSERFRGLSATFEFDKASGSGAIRYLGDRKELELGALYALGIDSDRMVVRVERTRPPQIKLDLALLALFLLVFFGPPLVRDGGLTCLVGVTGLLLSERLLFSYRAAINPPDFFLRGYGEARLALWLVPAALLFARTIALLLRHRAGAAGAGRGRFAALRQEAGRLGWPLAGLVVASVGSMVVARGLGNLGSLAALPLLLAGLLVLWPLVEWSPWGARRLERWRTAGWGWKHWWLVLIGLAVLAVRSVGDQIGMSETLRFPAVGFRVLWTVIQLPLCAFAVALSLQRLEEGRRRMEAGAPPDAAARSWLGGIVAIGLFLGLAFFGVAIASGDRGLLMAHSLATVAALVLLVAWPGRVRSTSRARKMFLAGAGLTLLPAVFFLTVNIYPQRLADALDLWHRATGKTEAVEAAADTATRLRATRNQQMFRLYLRANPQILSEVGVKPAERVAIQYETLQNYAKDAGATGGGYNSATLPRHLGRTYLNDLVPTVFVLAEFGKVGVLALALLYAALLAVPLLTGQRADRLGAQGRWLMTMALLALALPSLYMILANLNLVLFTGKNCYLLALDSVSDVLESSALLGLAAFGITLGKGS